MPTTNPIRVVYQAIWSMLEGHSDFATLVGAEKRVKYTGTLIQATEKDTLTQADFPYVRVVAVGLRPHIEETSNSSALTILWKVEVSSGSRQSATLFGVEWAIYEALANWRTYFVGLTMDGDGYTVDCRPAAVRTTLGDPEVDRGTRGWSSIWAGITELKFKTASLGT